MLFILENELVMKNIYIDHLTPLQWSELDNIKNELQQKRNGEQNLMLK